MRLNLRHGSRLTLIGLAVSLVLLGPVSSHGSPVRDDNEVGGSLGYDQGTGSRDDGSINSNAYYARYFVPWFNVGLRQGFVYTFRSKLPDRWLATTYPSVEFLYNTHPDQVVVPYINVGLGIAWNDRGNAGLVAPGAGLKFYLNEQTFVGLSYNYVFLFNDVGNTFSSGINSVRAGFGYDWGGDRTSWITKAAAGVVNAGSRVEAAAGRTENAANKVEAAGSEVEKASNRLEGAFQKSMLK
jgi:hypothetical protein